MSGLVITGAVNIARAWRGGGGIVTEMVRLFWGWRVLVFPVGIWGNSQFLKNWPNSHCKFDKSFLRGKFGKP